MIAVDTSVIVAGFASWHACHGAAAAILTKGPRAPSHAVVETYSVLTRLPPPHRAPAALVAAFLAERFNDLPLALPPRAHMQLIESAGQTGITGGAIYDAVIAATVKHAKGRLLTCDRRAAGTYRRVGVEYEIIG